MDHYHIFEKQVELKNKEKKLIQQFKYEASLIAKDNIAALMREAFGVEDDTMMETFVLEDHLPAFIGKFKENQEKQKDNLWIVKPTNMARSIDTWVTDNLDLMIRQMESGPKIAQKYISRPLTV